MSKRGVVEVIITRRMKYYDICTEIVDPKAMGVEDDCELVEMTGMAHTKSGDYIGSSKRAYRLVHRFGITQFERTAPDHSVCSIGYAPKTKKWYGWSHRAIYGFSIGSTCKKGDCHYIPSSFTQIGYDCSFREGDMCNASTWRKVVAIDPDKPEGLLEVTGPVRGRVRCSRENCVIELGRGEWAAKTMEDAKQMAIDFARSVSG